MTKIMIGMTSATANCTLLTQSSAHTTSWLPAFNRQWLNSILSTWVHSDTEPLLLFTSESMSCTSTRGTVSTHDHSVLLSAVLKLQTQSVSTNCSVCHGVLSHGCGRTCPPNSSLTTATRDEHWPPMTTMLGSLSATSSPSKSSNDVNTDKISLSTITQLHLHLHSHLCQSQENYI